MKIIEGKACDTVTGLNGVTVPIKEYSKEEVLSILKNRQENLRMLERDIDKFNIQKDDFKKQISDIEEICETLKYI